MKKLFVCQSVEIQAPTSKVWAVLTRPEYTDQWSNAFAGGTAFHIQSDWKLGSPVLWKDQEGRTIVEGSVTALDPDRLLRFTAFDVRNPEKPLIHEEDGITYKLMTKEGKLTLHLMQGDFSSLAEGKKYHEASAEVWSRVLPKIKTLAEA
jgi:uncharacterized protein YndB with AHSA1/START domain